MNDLYKRITELLNSGLSLSEVKKQLDFFLMKKYGNDKFFKSLIKDIASNIGEEITVIDLKQREELSEVYSKISQDYAKAKGKIINSVSSKVQSLLRADASKMAIDLAVKNTVGTFRGYYKTISRTAVTGFDMAYQMKDTDEKTRFKYVGGAAERDWCRARLAESAAGKIWTKAEIEAMNNGQGSNPLYFCGGFNCRHQWVEVVGSVNAKTEPINKPAPKPKPEPVQSNIPKTGTSLNPKINKEFTAAKTVAEANKYLNETLGFEGSLNGLDIDYCNVINKTLTSLTQEYRAAGLNAVNSVAIKGSTYAQVNIPTFKGNAIEPKRELQFNTNIQRTLGGLDELLSKQESSSFGVSKDATGLVTHEFAHVLTIADLMQKYPNRVAGVYEEISKIKSNYTRAMNKVKKDGGDVLKHEDFISRYGQTNIHEFTAEAFADAMLNPKPSRFSKQVKEVIDKYYKNIKE